MNEESMVGSEQPFEDAVSIDPQLNEGNQLVRLTLYPLLDQENPAPAQMRKPVMEHVLEPSTPRSQSLPKFLTKSFLPFCVLHLLSIEPRYGNEILSWLRQRAGLWAASPGTVYPLLQQLENEGLIRGRWEPGIKRPRHVYEITGRGRESVRELRGRILPQLEVSLALLTQLLEEIQIAEK